MIKELGFSQYAFGGRQEHVNLMAEELMIAKAAGIKLVRYGSILLTKTRY